jgi:hypothetical protein
MQGLILLILAGVLLCCCGLFLHSLPSTTSDAPSALAGVNVGHVNRVANAPDPVSHGSYPFTPALEFQDTDNGPVKASLLTMLVQALAYIGASVGWSLMTNDRRRQAMGCPLFGDRSWLAVAPEASSFLGVFRL